MNEAEHIGLEFVILEEFPLKSLRFKGLKEIDFNVDIVTAYKNTEIGLMMQKD